jgi:CRISPR/Cas system CMR subunit Cmr4 (Cas7 group RAMP superfamily)
MPLARLTFEVTFHGPIRVGTGHAGHGLDDIVDPDVVVPGSSLKGLMRAEAGALLGNRHPWVKEVFGTARRPSAWHWGDIRAHEDTVRVAARIKMDSEHGTAVDGGLFLAEHHWPDATRFEVIQFVAVDPTDRRRHELVLTASALSMRSVGGDRNRGFGWVDVRRVDSGFAPDVLDEITELLGARA